MKFASFIKQKIINTRLHEEKLYEHVYEEVKQGIRRDGLWAKALASSEGNEAKAKSLYLQLRVQSLADEMKIDRDIKHQIEKSQKSDSKKNKTRKLKTKDPEYIICSSCKFEQWIGYDKCQKCGAEF